MTIPVRWGCVDYLCTLVPEAGPDPDPAPVRVTAYSQNDERWALQYYAGGVTFGKAGCLVVAVSMIASLAYAEPMLPPVVARSLRLAGAFEGALLSHPARIPGRWACCSGAGRSTGGMNRRTLTSWRARSRRMARRSVR